MAPAPNGVGAFFAFLKVLWVIYWARNYDQRTATEAGSVKCIPDQLIFFEGGCHVKDLGATGTYVDRAKVPQIGPERLRKDIVELASAPHSWQGE
jgi:hypothetical protein